MASMHRAHHARIEGADHVLDGDGGGVAGGYGSINESLFQGAGLVLGVPGGEIPGGGGDDLVARQPAFFDAQPVAQAAPGGFHQAHALGPVR